jgi:DNA-binding MarR family transcriptional regulator
VKTKRNKSEETLDLGVLNAIWHHGDEHYLPLRLILVAKLIDRYIDRLLADKADLSVPEWRVVAQLSMLGKSSVRKMARQACVDPAEVSRSAASLEKRGYVQREENEADRRSPQFSLTREGAAHFAQFRPYWNEFSRSLLADMSPADAAVMNRSLTRFARAILDLLGENAS